MKFNVDGVTIQLSVWQYVKLLAASVCIRVWATYYKLQYKRMQSERKKYRAS